MKRVDLWLVTTVIKPHAATTPSSFRTSAEHNARVIEFLSHAGLVLLGQVHTHGGKYVNHSAGDDQDAFMPKENLMSWVVPYYGRQGMRPLNRCGIHRYECGHFRRLETREIDSEVCIVPTYWNLSV